MQEDVAAVLARVLAAVGAVGSCCCVECCCCRACSRLLLLLWLLLQMNTLALEDVAVA